MKINGNRSALQVSPAQRAVHDKAAAIIAKMPKALQPASAQRFLPYLTLSWEDRAGLLLQEAKHFDWAAGTTEGYWRQIAQLAALVSERGVGESAPAFARKVCRKLEAAAKEAGPAKPPVPAWPRQIELAAEILHHQHEREAEIALHVIYALAQRPFEVLRLPILNVTKMRSGPDGVERIAILFNQGKTTGRCQPYTLHLNADSPTGRHLWHLREAALINHYVVMFGCPSHTHELIVSALRHVNPDLEARSLRRGALSNAANKGMPIPMLLRLSRHASTDMLQRYLSWGRYDAVGARDTSEVADLVDNEVAYAEDRSPRRKPPGPATEQC